MIKSDLRLARPDGGELHLHYRAGVEERSGPTVIFSHGFTADGAESHRMFLRMADRYNALGIATIKFDYFGCGYSDGDFLTSLHITHLHPLHRPGVPGATQRAQTVVRHAG